MHLFGAPPTGVWRGRGRTRGGKGGKKIVINFYKLKFIGILILYNNLYLNCVEVAGLDYEKVWYKVLGQVICHWRAKQWYLKLYFWKL